MKLFSSLLDGLQKNMDLRLQRQTLINSNIANADTPGYRAKDIKFVDQLKDFLEMSDESMRSPGSEAPSVDDIQGEVITQAGELSPDQNQVDLDRQMSELSSNAFNYRASAKMSQKKLALLKYVINSTR